MDVTRSQNRWLSSATSLLVISDLETLVMLYQVVNNTQLVAHLVVMTPIMEATHMQWMITIMMITGMQVLCTKLTTGQCKNQTKPTKK